MDALEEASDDHFRVVMAMWKANGGLLYTKDMLIGSVVNRSFELVEAFLSALDTWSVSVASALVRVQLDNLLRIHLFMVSPDVDAIYDHIASDKGLGKLPLPQRLIDMIPEDKRKPHGMVHADWALVEIAAHTFPWIKGAYQTGSSWIHHSNAHLGITHRVTGEDQFSGRLPPDIDQFDEKFWASMCDVMLACTLAINEFIEMWTESKDRRPNNNG
jgi:hypothetical protein